MRRQCFSGHSPGRWANSYSGTLHASGFARTPASRRKNAIMGPMGVHLSNADIENVAAYLASLK